MKLELCNGLGLWAMAACQWPPTVKRPTVPYKYGHLTSH
jgi:hypothetical protein